MVCNSGIYYDWNLGEKRLQNKDERLKRQIEFLLETDKMKTIGRQNIYCKCNKKRE